MPCHDHSSHRLRFHTVWKHVHCAFWQVVSKHVCNAACDKVTQTAECLTTYHLVFHEIFNNADHMSHYKAGVKSTDTLLCGYNTMLYK